jgi:hypothetical protein
MKEKEMLKKMFSKHISILKEKYPNLIENDAETLDMSSLYTM